MSSSVAPFSSALNFHIYEYMKYVVRIYFIYIYIYIVRPCYDWVP